MRHWISFFSLLICTHVNLALASPCGTPDDPNIGRHDLQVWQDCGLGTWYIRAVDSTNSATIYASSSLTIKEKSGADDERGELHLSNGGKRLDLTLDARNGEKRLVFTAAADTSVAIIPGSRVSLRLGQFGDNSSDLTDLTDPAVKHLFLVIPNEGQYLNKGEVKTLRYVASSHFNNIFLSIGRSPYQATWLRDPLGNQAFSIPNTGKFDWDVLKINSACHDFYITIGGYANDGSGYLKSPGQTFHVLHPYDYGFVCPVISY